MSFRRPATLVALCSAMLLIASISVASAASPFGATERPSRGLQRWASEADPAAVLAAIRQNPDKIPAEFDERLRWADSDGSLQVMVSLVDRDDEIANFVAANTADVSWYGDDPRFLARITPRQLIALVESPVVMFVEPDYPITNFMSGSAMDVRARTTNADGVYTLNPDQGEMGQLVSNIEGLTAEQVTGSGVRVAVTDSGIDKTNRDFGGWDCEAGPYQPCESRIAHAAATEHLIGFETSDALPTTEAASGHGSHVAGTIAGNGYYSRDFGADAPRYGGDGYVLGIAPSADLVSVKNGDSQSAGFSTAALQWQLDHAEELGIKVSSNSWGCLGGCSFNPNSATAQVIRDLYLAGVVTTFAVGNDGGGPDGSEFSGNAQSPYVLGVAAYDDENDELAGFSSRGKKGEPMPVPETWTPQSEPASGYRRPDIAAPGVRIWSAATLTGGTSSGIPRVSIGDAGAGRGPTVEYRIMSGTSMATPHVAGAAAVLAGACPDAAALDIMRAVKVGADEDKVLKSGGDDGTAEPFEVGYGGLDVRAALDWMLVVEVCGGEGHVDPSPTPTPTESTTPTPTPTPSLGEQTTYYFHSGTGVHTADKLESSHTFDTNEPVFTDPALATDVPAAGNVEPGQVWDPSWVGSVSGDIRELTVDFWAKAPEEEIQTGGVTWRVSLWDGSTEIALPNADVEGLNLTGPTRFTHTFTTMLSDPADQGSEVPLAVTPSGTLGIQIRPWFINSVGATIFYDSVDFPSGFSIRGEAVEPSPTPTESPQLETTNVDFTEGSENSGQYTDATFFEARLTDSEGKAIRDAELTFDLAGEGSSRTFDATTDEEGIASATPTLTEKPGPYQLTVRYEGDEDREGSADTISFVVEKEDTALELEVEGRGKNRTLTARISDLDTPSDGIEGRTIDFYADGKLIGSETTNEDGLAAFEPPPRYRGGRHEFEARFEGDDFYLSSSDRQRP